METQPGAPTKPFLRWHAERRMQFSHTPVGRIESALIVAGQVQEEAREQIRIHEGLVELIDHRVQHDLEITRELLWAQADLTEATEHLERARQEEAKLRVQMQRAEGMVF